MSKYDNCLVVLPDIEMIGGDTTPWFIRITDEDGTAYSGSTITGDTAKLDIVPFKLTTAMGYDAPSVAPLLTLTTTVATDTTGPYIQFEPAYADTKDMRGKFLYQITVSGESYYRFAQGNLLIKQNANRA